jgi:hypothetical protein
MGFQKCKSQDSAGESGTAIWVGMNPGLVRQVRKIRAVFSDENAPLLLHAREEHREKSM